MITITDATKELGFLDYVDRKNQVKGQIASISQQILALQDAQVKFTVFLADKPEYALHYTESVDAIEGLATKFEQLSDISNLWLTTVAEIKAINPLF